VLGADAGQRVQRVAVAVEAGELHAPLREVPQVLLAQARRRQQPVDVAVRRRDEPAAVDLDRRQPEVLEGVERPVEGAVVQAGGVGAELHRWLLFYDGLS